MYRNGLFEGTGILLAHHCKCRISRFAQLNFSLTLVQCDIQMPVKNGYDTCRDIRGWELKNHYPQIPIMALSANAMTDQIEDAARAGFNDYVTKPIKHNELGKMMMGLLDPNRPLLLLRDRLRADSEDHHRD